MPFVHIRCSLIHGRWKVRTYGRRRRAQPVTRRRRLRLLTATVLLLAVGSTVAKAMADMQGETVRGYLLRSQSPR